MLFFAYLWRPNEVSIDQVGPSDCLVVSLSLTHDLPARGFSTEFWTVKNHTENSRLMYGKYDGDVDVVV